VPRKSAMSASPAPVPPLGDRPPFEVSPDDPRLPGVRATVAARLVRFRDGMTDEQFETLVSDVARFHLRWFG
jgi:hypothetical protein